MLVDTGAVVLSGELHAWVARAVLNGNGLPVCGGGSALPSIDHVVNRCRRHCRGRSYVQGLHFVGLRYGGGRLSD